MRRKNWDGLIFDRAVSNHCKGDVGLFLFRVGGHCICTLLNKPSWAWSPTSTVSTRQFIRSTYYVESSRPLPLSPALYHRFPSGKVTPLNATTTNIDDPLDA